MDLDSKKIKKTVTSNIEKENVEYTKTLHVIIKFLII